MTSVLRLEREEDVAVLVLDNPAKLNPLSRALQGELRAAYDSLRTDRSVRALLITGSGKGFCVGADLSPGGNLAGEAGDDPRSLGQRTADAMHEHTNRLVADLQQMPFPVVSAVNGACAGAGVGLALAADVTLAARSAYFYLPFMARLGLVPDLGCTWFYERRLGRARAMALAMLGERLSAEQAAQWGLVWSCVDDEALHAQALDVARGLARLPAHAALELRGAFDAAGHNGLPAQLHYEAERQRVLLDQPSFAEGVRAFLEKRDPQFAPR